ncbi:stress enhanced protein 2, chloroplastic-like [Oryza brachyantha]|uniref:stress enhanced protein 2, chloroplastic-like n=1 Tax=Oryza brachyantha TaxID=4533 RepID=UPI001ADCA177|nr:stress enhanced protein 2, chloroplastic-like [Oryza brachyantha]
MGEFHRAVNGTIICEMMPNQRAPPSSQQATQRDSGSEKIVLQPRLCTLRLYSGVVAWRRLPGEEETDGGVDGAGSSPFFASLADYIDSTRKSQNFEIISGRLAMSAV